MRRIILGALGLAALAVAAILVTSIALVGAIETHLVPTPAVG